jgi:hypothetical protein
MTPDGPWQNLWTYDRAPGWRDGEIIDRTLRWPEVDKHITSLPAGTRRIYIRYSLDGIAIDDVRLATVHPSASEGPNGTITHIWKEDGVVRQHVQAVNSGTKHYAVNIPAGSSVENVAIIIESQKHMADR